MDVKCKIYEFLCIVINYKQIEQHLSIYNFWKKFKMVMKKDDNRL